MNSKEIGILGENIALNYLKQRGYKILDRNYLPKFISGPQRGEIDIIAKKEDIIYFIEVKSLTRNSIFQPEEKVNFLKKKKIVKMAESWLTEKRFPFNSQWQIDIISIKIDLNSKKAKIRHLKNAIF